MRRKRVLVVEDDAAIRRGVIDALAFAGFDAIEAGEGHSGAAAALEADYDLLLLDLVLPGRDGLDILRAVRSERASMPVIVVTARGSEEDRIRGLGLGADDYMIKPFSVLELLARIEAVLRRSPERRGRVSRVEAFECRADLERRVVEYDDGSTCELSEREQALLSYLATHPDRAISREEILTRVWGLNPRGVTTRTIDMHIVRLREKLRDDSQEPRAVLTVRGRGYMLGPGVVVT